MLTMQLAVGGLSFFIQNVLKRFVLRSFDRSVYLILAMVITHNKS